MTLLLWIYVLSTQSVFAQTLETDRGYQIKANMLYHFSQFVEWPNNASIQNSDIFVIAVLGNDPFGAVLDSTLAGRTIHGKTLIIRRYTSVEEVQDVDLVFLGASKDGRLKEDLDHLRRRHILTVGESSRFSQHGGIIRFLEIKNNVRFEINREAASLAGLGLSSQLLVLAITTKSIRSS